MIDPTVAALALKEIAPGVVAPGHCSGWRAIHRVAREIPEAFVQTSVGTV